MIPGFGISEHSNALSVSRLQVCGLSGAKCKDIQTYSGSRREAAGALKQLINNWIATNACASLVCGEGARSGSCSAAATTLDGESLASTRNVEKPLGKRRPFDWRTASPEWRDNNGRPVQPQVRPFVALPCGFSGFAGPTQGSWQDRPRTR